MELALLVWVVDLLTKLGGFLGFALALFSGVIVVALFGTMCALSDNYEVKSYWKKYFPTKTLITGLLLVWIIPSQQTMKYIAAGYLIQETFESEFVQETVTLSQKAVIKQLQIWSEGDTDIQELIKSVDIPLPKNNNEQEIPNEK